MTVLCIMADYSVFDAWPIYISSIKNMVKPPMDKLLLPDIHIVILAALLLLTRGKSLVEPSSSFAHPNDTVTSCIAGERSALVGFKAGLSDPANLLSSWKGDDCCKWKGVHCSNRNNHVVKLDLPGHHCDPDFSARPQALRGNISSSLLGLQRLWYLNLSCNWLRGVQIPEFLGSLHTLRYMDLSWSGLTGRIPPQLGNLSNLQYLNLDTSTYSTDITWLSKLTSLEHLDLSNVNLSSIVHWLPVVNMLPSMKVLRLSYCDLRTTSSSLQLSNLTSLETLDLSSNNFYGRVTPDWFGGFTSLKYLDISFNNFYGQIPVLPTSLHELDLSRNNFVGPLLLDFGAPSLRKLILLGNSISGTIPSSLCKLQSLLILDISENKLTGSIPNCSVDTSTTNMTSMSIVHLSLRYNNLSGEFPSFLKDCQHLVFLDLSHNHFFGTLPTWIGEKLPYLAFLLLRSNMFNGHIPEELTELGNLQCLDLASNNITGSIPTSIVNYKWMILERDYHGIYGDAFHGTFSYGVSVVPDNILTYAENLTVTTKGQEILYTGRHIYMVSLDLSCNNLVGDIPEEITTLVRLENLNLSWNTFSGKIPENIGALTQVEALDLSHNELSGQIPASLSAMTSLLFLNMSYNKLTGEVPSGNQLEALEDLEYIYIGNQGLCGPPLSQKCAQPESIPAPQEHHEDANNVVSFIAMGSGYVMGLWVVFCTFLFNRKWRVIWYSACDSSYDWVYVRVAVTWASWTREKTMETENDR